MQRTAATVTQPATFEARSTCSLCLPVQPILGVECLCQFVCVQIATASLALDSFARPTTPQRGAVGAVARSAGSAGHGTWHSPGSLEVRGFACQVHQVQLQPPVKVSRLPDLSNLWSDRVRRVHTAVWIVCRIIPFRLFNCV